MPEISVYESERGYIDRTLKYSRRWSVDDKRGNPVLRSDLTSPGVFFKAKDAAGTEIVDFSDADSTEIEWLDVTRGMIRIKLGTETDGKAGDGYAYEIRVKLADNTYVTVEAGQLHVLESTVDRP